VFEKAQCIKCHRHGGRGEAAGPDLTTAGQRFQRREILESVLYPSHVISDQYSSRTIITTDGRTLTGIVAPAAQDTTVVLQATGVKATIRNSDIEQNVPSKQSAMPEGLFNNLSLEEIADLLAFLSRPPADVATQPSRSR
jgi:putative heme-binding domain-containing protein